MTNSKSLDLIKDIIVNIDNDKYPYLKKILVENKSDIKSENSNDELQQFINDNEDIEYIIISVKTGDNIDNLLDKIYNEVNSPDNNIPINKIAKTNLKEDLDATFSLILLGESSVGKTNFMMRYSLNIFETKFLSTYGLNRESKRVQIYGKKIYNVLITDTAGQERFRSLPKRYYKNQNGVLLLFSLDDKKSFLEVSNWMNDIKNNNQENENIIIYLIGNKIDLIENGEEKITKEEKEELIEKIGVKYYEISCKWDLNVEEVMARMILDCYKSNRPRNPSFQLTGEKTLEKEAGCCIAKIGGNDHQ